LNLAGQPGSGPHRQIGRFLTVGELNAEVD